MEDNFRSFFSGTEKQDDDDDLIFEDFARMRLKGEHTETTDA